MDPKGEDDGVTGETAVDCDDDPNTTLFSWVRIGYEKNNEIMTDITKHVLEILFHFKQNNNA